MAQRSEWLIGKTEVSSGTGVVATMVRQATEAGIAMLQRGGNAMDAAVAAGFAAGVAEPFNSGLGGIAVLVYHEARTGRTHVFDGTGTLPAATRADQFRFADSGAAAGIYGWPEVVDDANNTGYLSPAVPGMPACLLEAQARFGRGERVSHRRCFGFDQPLPAAEYRADDGDSPRDASISRRSARTSSRTSRVCASPSSLRSSVTCDCIAFTTTAMNKFSTMNVATSR